MKKASATPAPRTFTFRVLGLKGQTGTLTDQCPKAILQFVGEVAGVDGKAVKISLDPKDCLKNAVVVPYDRAKTAPGAIAKPLQQYWDLRWFACPCGATAAEPGDC